MGEPVFIMAARGLIFWPLAAARDCCFCMARLRSAASGLSVSAGLSLSFCSSSSGVVCCFAFVTSGAKL